MRAEFAEWKRFPFFVKFMLGSTFVLVLARGMSVPFLALFMSRIGMSHAEIGIAIGFSVLLGSLGVS